MKNLALPLLAIAFLSLVACTPKEEPATDTPPASGEVATVSFDTEVKPILTKNCISCHQGEFAKEKVDLTDFETVSKGGEHGPIFVAGKSSDSLMFKVLTGDGVDQMPPGGKLTDAEIETIKNWIDAGATK